LINSNKLIDYKVPSYQIMIDEMYKWILNNKESYPQYNLD
jgi:hypothetical protein